MSEPKMLWQNWVREIAQRLHIGNSGDELSFVATSGLEALAAELRCPRREIRRAKRLAELLERNAPEFAACRSLAAAATLLNQKEGAYFVRSSALQKADGTGRESSGTLVRGFDWPPVVSIRLIESEGVGWLEQQPASSLDCIYTVVPLDRRKGGPGPPGASAAARAEAEATPAVFLSAARRTVKPDGLCLLWCRGDLQDAVRSAAEGCGMRVESWPRGGLADESLASPGARPLESKEYGVLLVLAGEMAPRVGDRELQYHQSIFAAEAQDAEHLRFINPNDMLIWVLDNLVSASATVVDPFADEGQIARAVLESGRSVVAVEADPARFDRLRRKLLCRL